MKGMVFQEFMNMVEEQFGFDMVDELIDTTNPLSGGAYTSVGTYPMSELAEMVQALSDRLDTPVPDLLRAFGEYLFPRLANGHPRVMEGIEDPFDLMETIEQHVHVEVRKLYDDARPPLFLTSRNGPDHLTLTYHSDRHLEDLAEGLIRGCLAHFKVMADIQRKSLENGSEQFTIIRMAP